MSNYFSKIPDFEYVSRLPDAKISDYIPVKNIFMRGKLREDIFQDASVSLGDQYRSRNVGVRDLPLRDMISLGAWRMGLGCSGKFFRRRRRLQQKNQLLLLQL